MKISEIKPGQIFTTDNTLFYPKLKLHKGFVSIRTQYIWLCKENVQATLLSWGQLRKIMNNWEMSQEEFNKYKEGLIKRYDVLEV